MPRILCVGKLCLDIVNYMDFYPREDSDHLSPKQRWTSGGNAANNCVVLKQLADVFEEDFQCDLFTVFGNDLASELVRKRLLEKFDVNLDTCPIRKGSDLTLSTSCIVVNRTNGSRTIVHCRNNVEDATAEEFQNAFCGDFSRYDWVHFEGRCVEEVRKMMDTVIQNRKNNPHPIISVEIEKGKPNIETLAGGADFIFLGKDFSQSRNCSNMTQAIYYMQNYLKEKSLGNDDCAPEKQIIVCPWGDKGACLLERDHNEPVYSVAFKPELPVIDTLGAGDTFFATFIFGNLMNGGNGKMPLNKILNFSCFVAGTKCGMEGFDALAENLKQCKADICKNYF